MGNFIQKEVESIRFWRRDDAIEAIGKSTVPRALCLVFQRQRDGPKDYEISLPKDWDLIITIMNTEELSVKEVENETVPISEITEMVSRKTVSGDRIKETDKKPL